MNDLPLDSTLARLEGGRGKRRISEEALRATVAGLTAVNVVAVELREGVPEGERNNSIASLAGHLLWHGVDPAVTLDLPLCWNATRCRPPLPADEVGRTVDSIMRMHLHEGEGQDAARS